jgi:4-amino-4-deoxy-L-arabinose transferase-like glycosyltransferase
MLGMGTTPLFDVDEGAFSEATREMLESGDFGFTFLNGKPRFDKPILVYWLQAL